MRHNFTRFNARWLPTSYCSTKASSQDCFLSPPGCMDLLLGLQTCSKEALFSLESCLFSREKGKSIPNCILRHWIWVWSGTGEGAVIWHLNGRIYWIIRHTLVFHRFFSVAYLSVAAYSIYCSICINVLPSTGYRLSQKTFHISIPYFSEPDNKVSGWFKPIWFTPRWLFWYHM